MFFNGIEVDVLSLGDADCIVVTQWNNGLPHRVLIDGGADAEIVFGFLLSRSYTDFWAVLCTHLHNDHARGLIKLVRNKALNISNGWMHNINKHASADWLYRASAASDGVKEVVEATKELAAAFASRGITPKEPFAGMAIAGWPNMAVLGPSLPYYNRVIAEFTEVPVPAPMPVVSLLRPSAGLNNLGTLAGLAGIVPPPSYPSLSTMFPPPTSRTSRVPLLAGALANSSVQKNPSTQPYNNTSVILGVDFSGKKLLFPADAGTEALFHVGPDWNHLMYLGIPHHGSDGNLSRKDIERFCPEFATISAKGDSCHPSRAIVSGLIKVGAKVASTHAHGNLWFHCGNVPARSNYDSIEFLKGTGTPEPFIMR